MYQSIFAAVFVFFQMAHVCDSKPSRKLVRMPSNCAGKNYCFTKHDGYPEKLIEYLLSDIEQLFDNINQPIFDPRRLSLDNPLRDCEVSVSVDPIYEIVDTNGDLRFVVQSKAKFKQIMRIEECKNPGRIRESTYNFNRIILEILDLHCVDHYIEQKFVVLSLDGTFLESVAVKGGIPVTCSCERGQ